MKPYKGFEEDMTCRGFKFKEGETYEENDAKLCERTLEGTLIGDPVLIKIDGEKYKPDTWYCLENGDVKEC